ncbi:MAG: hypothetical protein ACLR17_03485 [Enterobacteriaceae bacterium]
MTASLAKTAGFFRRTADGHGIEHHYWHADDATASVAARLRTIADRVLAALPEARLADDQPFRLTSLAFARPATRYWSAIVNTLRQAGCRRYRQQLVGAGLAGWLRQATMTRRTLAQHYGVDIDREREAILYSGDSTNDAPMFAFQTHGRRQHRPAVSGSTPRSPRWVTLGPGGAGFVEMAQAVFGQKSL